MPEYSDPLSAPDALWRSEPATDAQKRKLRFYRRRFPKHLTKGEAAELIDDAMDSVDFGDLRNGNSVVAAACLLRQCMAAACRADARTMPSKK